MVDVDLRVGALTATLVYDYLADGCIEVHQFGTVEWLVRSFSDTLLACIEVLVFSCHSVQKSVNSHTTLPNGKKWLNGETRGYERETMQNFELCGGDNRIFRTFFHTRIR